MKKEKKTINKHHQQQHNYVLFELNIKKNRTEQYYLLTWSD